MRRSLAIAKFVVLITLVCAVIILAKGGFFDIKQLLAQGSKAGIESFIVFTAIFALAFFLLFPLSLGTLAGAVFLDPLLNIACTYTAIIIVAAVDFSLARCLGRDFVCQRLYFKKVSWVDSKIEKGGMRAAIIYSILPFGNFASSNCIAGLSKMRLGHFLFGLMIVKLPGRFVYTYAAKLWGYFAFALLSKILIIVITLLFFVGIPVYVWKKFKL